MLAEVDLPRPIRSHHDAYVVHPALLDACFQSVAVHPEWQARARRRCSCRWAYIGCVPTVPLATRVTAMRGNRADAAVVEADLDLLDEHGTVLLTVSGVELGTGCLGGRQTAIACSASGC